MEAETVGLLREPTTTKDTCMIWESFLETTGSLYYWTIIFTFPLWVSNTTSHSNKVHLAHNLLPSSEL